MNANIATINVSDSSVLDRTHPPVLGTMKVFVDATLAEGLVVAKNSEGLVVAYDQDGAAPLNAPVGVLVHECDTTKDDAAVVIKHGTVVKLALLVGTAAPDTTDLARLESLGIYAV